MHAAPPQLTVAEAEGVALRHFGHRGRAHPLPGERDQNFRLEMEGEAPLLLKVSNRGEDPAVLRMQLRALRQVAATDPELPVPRVLPSVEGLEMVALPGGEVVRMLTYLPGSHLRPTDLTSDGLYQMGRISARLGHALRGFFDPAADQSILWNPRRVGDVRPLLSWVPDSRRPLVERALDRSEPSVVGALPALRSQVIHNDLSFSNLTFEGPSKVSGILDFGDMCHTALVSDLAVTCESILEVPAGFDALAIVASGFQAVTPLEPEEVELIPDLLLARWATLIAVSAWRGVAFPETSAYVRGWQDGPLQMLSQVEEMGEDRWRRLVCNSVRGALSLSPGGAEPLPASELVEARRRLLGPALSPLSYSSPLQPVGGKGALLFDRDGSEYLDAYNNVPVLGHANPLVARAVGAQTAVLNTNTRYLYRPVLELAEQLVATMPPGLDTVLFVNSGSEANDLAWRLARAFTGGGGAVVTHHAYHGMTSAVAEFSPDEWHVPIAPPHVAMVDPPDGYRGPHRRERRGWTDGYLAQLDAAVVELAGRGLAPAALLVDPAFTSEGVVHPPPGYLKALFRRWQDAGGLVVADEVQTGYGRLGSELWGFARHGALPDLVTLGKPMGNGYPIGAVVTRAEIVNALAEKTEWFSTFGGNPVASMAGLAVLGEARRPEFLDRVEELGGLLGGRLRALGERHPAIGDVRQLGLLVGVELVRSQESRSPFPELAARVVESMRRQGVLVGRTGRDGNVIKIRPPLVVLSEQLEAISVAFGRALDAESSRPGPA
jgi:4-aminobutyrate aminotransferase-like enzyme/Ser/Thr protein kinase RdoA (MazF antagonist)